MHAPMIENHWVSVIAIDVQMFSCACFFPSTLLYISRPFRCSNSQFVISHIIQCFFLFLHITTLFILYGIPWYVVISWRQCNRKWNVVNCMRSARTHDGICCFNDINSFFVDFFLLVYKWTISINIVQILNCNYWKIRCLLRWLAAESHHK